MNEWCWIILGCAMGIVFCTISFFCIIQQNDNLQKEVAQLREEVAGHEEVIKQYEFYVWHNMKFFDEKESE